MEEPWTEFASSRLENLTEPNPFFEPFSNVDLQPSTELGTLGLRDEAKGDGDSDEDDGISSFEGVRPAWADNESTTKCTGCMLPFVFLRRRRRLIFPSLSELTPPQQVTTAASVGAYSATSVQRSKLLSLNGLDTTNRRGCVEHASLSSSTLGRSLIRRSSGTNHFLPRRVPLGVPSSPPQGSTQQGRRNFTSLSASYILCAASPSG